ncbi:carboxymuconolactone decarboxylase family protein [Microbacterium ulmi]
MEDARSTDVSGYVSIHPSELDPDQRALYERIVGGPRAGSPAGLLAADGRLQGPFGLMLLSPEVGHPLQELGAAIRFRSSLDDLMRESVILAVAVERKSEFEWHVHSRVSEALGIDPLVVAAIGRRDDAALPDHLRPVVRMARSIATRNSMSEVALARHGLGDRAFFETLVTATYYALLADLLQSFGVGLPAGVPERFAGGDQDC